VKCNLLGGVLNAADLASLGYYHSGSRYGLYYSDSKRTGSSRAQTEEDDGRDEPRSAS
jgi:hypothetical protein